MVHEDVYISNISMIFFFVGHNCALRANGLRLTFFRQKKRAEGVYVVSPKKCSFVWQYSHRFNKMSHFYDKGL